MTQKELEESRRKFLKTAGRIAVYTPPAMLALSHPSLAMMQKSGNGNTNPESEYPNGHLQSLGCTSPSGPATKNISVRFCRVR